MKRLLIGVLAGLTIGAAPAVATGPDIRPRDVICREVYTLGLEQYDRAFLALEDILERGNPGRAALRLQRMSDTWITFDRLGRACARVR